MDMKKIEFTEEEFNTFKKEYNKALDNKDASFKFKGNEYVTDFAKYLIEYLTPKFDALDVGLWYDEGKEGSSKEYTSRKKVLSLIRGILKSDKDLLNVYGGVVENVTDDDLFEIAANHYSINEG